MTQNRRSAANDVQATSLVKEHRPRACESEREKYVPPYIPLRCAPVREIFAETPLAVSKSLKNSPDLVLARCAPARNLWRLCEMSGEVRTVVAAKGTAG